MDRIVVIGSTGLLGQYIVEEALLQGCQVLGTHYATKHKYKGASDAHLDITDPFEVRSVLNEFRPDVVVLTSAATNVDWCEANPEGALETNAKGAENVAAVCHNLGCRMMFISTDYVFSGQKEGRYAEDDVPIPLSVYARTKLEGERIVLRIDPCNAVCRVSTLYGWNRVSDKANFVTWALGEMRKGREIRLFGDQWVSPTYAPHCARTLVTMAIRGASGIYHTSGPDRLERHQMGVMIAETFGLDPSLCRKIITGELQLLARRGRNTALDVKKAETEYNISMLPYPDGLREMRSREYEP